MYHPVLFAHFLGVALLVAAAGLELTTLRRIARAATNAEVCAALADGALIPKLYPIAALLLIASGAVLVALTGTEWRAGWLVVSLFIVFTLSVVGHAVVGAKMKALAAAAFGSSDRGVNASVDRARRDVVLNVAGALSATQIAALLYLMSNKPSFAVSAAIVVAAAAVSVAIGTRFARAQVPRRGITTSTSDAARV